MSLKIYNSLTRKKEQFVPLRKGKVSIYVCGPTVYDEPHIGHARSAYVFDVIRRYLETKYKIKFVRNVTDVDDKIINKAKVEFKGEDLKAAVKKVADKYFKSYSECMNKLGIKPPSKEPKATEYIKKMVKFIAKLIKTGIAYESGGDVYFDITKAKQYGKLSHQSPEMMESGARVSPGENKKSPLDFALWKKAKDNEPSWPSPWGRGRPGWHIECSVMSSDILGDKFDIHGGGIDLIFPHHENEVAQSEGAGKDFANYWIHNGLLTINGQKMAKSLGNYITVKEIEDRGYRFDVLKILFLQSHYSHPVDFTWARMDEVNKAYERFYVLFHKIDREFGSRDIARLPTGSRGNVDHFKKEFEEAMDDNFNTPMALSVLFNMVNECNKILEDKQDSRRFMLQYAMSVIIELGGILGLSFKDIKVEKSDTWVTIAIAQREQLRKEGKYAEADEIRKMLDEKGIILEDSKDGATWRRKI